MKKNVFTEVPSFNEKQLKKQAQKQIEFLKIMFPFLQDLDEWNEGCIELRPVFRDGEYKHIRSYNAWHIRQKDEEKLLEFLNILNGRAYCVYYSVFAFDYTMEVTRQDGKKYQKGKVNKQNSIFTTVLPIDFDKMSYEEFLKEKQKLMDLGIETVDTFSGHGFQPCILLNHKVYDKQILEKFTNLLISKGFKVDPAITQSNQVMRMPFTFNCKELDTGSSYYSETAEVQPTTIINYTDKRYHIGEIFEKINSLETVIPQGSIIDIEEIKNIKTEPLTRTIKKTEQKEIKEVKSVEISNLRTIYNMINFDRLPIAVQKMLAGSQDGLRNKAILFLIPFLRNSLGLSLENIKEIMKSWGSLCNPKLSDSYIDSEVNRIYALDFKGKHGKYCTDLAKAYGYLEFDEYSRENTTRIPNSFFDDFDVITDGSVRIYLALKLEESINKTKGTNFTAKQIQNICKISKETFYRNIKDLVSMGYICKKRANRRNKEEYVYYINPFFNSTKGCTLLENAVIKLMLIELTTGEMKVYSYLCKMIGDSKNSCWAGQKYLSKEIGKTQQGISLITQKLNDKKYIIKTTEEKNGVKHSRYNLNY